MLAVIKLIDYIGKFGGSHIDSKDSPAGFTSMLCLSHLPDRYCPGHIILLEIGVHVRLNRLRTIDFSALHWHVGTFPSAPPGERKLATDALRLTVVGYPNVASFEGGHLAFFGAVPYKGKQQLEDLPSNEPFVDRRGEFRIGPEMTGTS